MKNLPIRLAISGALGKMGKTLILEIQKQHNIYLGAALVKKNDPKINQDIGKVIGIGKLNIKITDNIESVINDFDILIDFSNPIGSTKYINACLKTKKNIIIGTTGFNEETKQLINNAAKKIGIVWSSNFSMGINLINKLLEIVTKTIGKDSDIDIIESHHREKIDAPSGTALTMAETIAKSMDWNLKEHQSYIRIGENKLRNKEKINFATIRAGDVVGKHTILFSTIGEQIAITHTANNRKTFAKGAIKAAKWISFHKSGLFNMRDVLNIF